MVVKFTSPRSYKIVQTNLNHARHAQELFYQCMDERDVGLAVIAEPYTVPKGNPLWAGAVDGSVAITWRRTEYPVPCAPLEAGDGLVMVHWGGVLVVGIYLSPRLRVADVEERLEKVARSIRLRGPIPTIVMGDFNAHATMWGSRRNCARGRVVIDWANALGLHCVNQGAESTCVRPQGESVVDLTWASPQAARLVKGWRVLADVESLSDHVHIEMELLSPTGPQAGRSSSIPKRWSLAKLDGDMLAAALIASSWPSEREDIELKQECEFIMSSITNACDIGMPRSRPRPRKATYWWSEELGELRRTAIRMRRGWLRSRRRQDPPDREDAARRAYKDAKYTLCSAISKAKAKSWADLLQTLDRDPWGLGYKIVRNKLKRWSPPTTELLDPTFLATVTRTLFPREEENSLGDDRRVNLETPWSDDWDITEMEMMMAVNKMKSKNTAPGPDGIPGKVVALAYRVVGSRMRRLLTRCLQEGVFPDVWKKANLVLLQKEGKPADNPSSYRPICLLDEMGKLLERIIARRIHEHLTNQGPDLSRHQFGFRRGKSTNDAILFVRRFTEEVTGEGGVVLAVSIDIVNAFNSLPWQHILSALEEHGIPPYLRRVLGAYLSDRQLCFRDRLGTSVTKEVRRGVPQGSVLGPILWDLGYDRVLSSVALPQGCKTVGYADDTVILASGENWEVAQSRANEALCSVTRAITALGLEVAPHKTEAIFFGDVHGENPPPGTEVYVGGSNIVVGPYMKYLGLVLDGKWSFEEHFSRLSPRLTAVANQCSRLMPNIGGPGGKARKLYATVVHSVALYGAPVWFEEALASRTIRASLRRVQRRIAIRTIRAYRTVSHAGATLLAGFPPVELVARMQAEVFNNTRKLQERQGHLCLRPGDERRIRTEAKLRLMNDWRRWLTDPSINGSRIIEAVHPRMDIWLARRWGHLTYRATQLITGHGCFGAYLQRIGRDAFPACQHCGAADDTAQHTLEVCEEWSEERQALTAIIGGNLSLPAVMGGILEAEEKWVAFTAFAEAIMTRKELAERIRRGEVPADYGAQYVNGPPPVGRVVGRRNRPRRRRPAAHQRD